MSKSDPSSKSQAAQQGAARRYNENNAAADIARISRPHQQLSQRQLNAIELLLRGLSDGEVAQRVGVDRGTVFRWWKNRPFVAEMDRQRQVITEQSAARLQALLEPALDILAKQVASSNEMVALRAATTLVRVASPARVQRIVETNRAIQKKSSSDNFDEALDAYINAPLPNDPRHAEAMRQIQEKFGVSDEDQSPDST